MGTPDTSTLELPLCMDSGVQVCYTSVYLFSHLPCPPLYPPRSNTVLVIFLLKIILLRVVVKEKIGDVLEIKLNFRSLIELQTNLVACVLV